MENLFNIVIDRVKRGAKFNVDFKRRSLKLDNKYIVKPGGKVNMPLTINNDDIEVEPNLSILQKISVLYDRYKHSVPSEYSEKRYRKYFRSLRECDLSDEDMNFGELRDIAQAKLECYILFSIITGTLKWEESWGKWFWQSEHDKDLVILREWVEPNIQ